MKTSYREMFDEVHASERLKEEVMNMTKQERNQVVKRVSVSFIVAAALAVILAGTALAAVIGVPETLQEWFNHQWTEAGGEEMPKAQSEVIESLVQPVGVTCINKGVAVTLDSVTPGEGGLWLMYKVKGEMLEDEAVDRWRFSGPDLGGRLMENEIVDDSVSVTIHMASEREVGVTEDGTHVFLLFYDAPKGVDFLEGGDLELRLRDITILGKWDGKEGSSLPVVGEIEAKWVLPFTLAPTENVEALTVKSATVPCFYNEYLGESRPAPMKITDIRITAMGISFMERAWKEGEKRDYVTEDIALQLKDGVEIAARLGGSLGALNVGEPYTHSWDLPVDLTKAEAVRFGDVVIPLEQPKK